MAKDKKYNPKDKFSDDGFEIFYNPNDKKNKKQPEKKNTTKK